MMSADQPFGQQDLPDFLVAFPCQGQRGGQLIWGQMPAQDQKLTQAIAIKIRAQPGQKTPGMGTACWINRFCHRLARYVEDRGVDTSGPDLQKTWIYLYLTKKK